MQLGSEITGFHLHATDGDIGTITDLLFDDESRRVRWIVVDTGKWLPGRKVLLPPSVLGEPSRTRRSFPVDLSSDQIKEAPGAETDRPVSRQLETDVFAYYGWTPYWGMAYPMAGAVPVDPVTPATAMNPDTATEEAGDPHLRSMEEVSGYEIAASDGKIGHIEDFVLDRSDWTIRYLLIDTRNWWPGKKVLIAPDWLKQIEWGSRELTMDATREQIRNAPEYDHEKTIDRPYEEQLWAHYGAIPYWI